MKKKIIVMICGLLVFIILVVGVIYFIKPGITARAESIRIDYMEYEVRQDDIDLINGVDEDVWEKVDEIRLENKIESSDGNYGRLFDVTYKIKLDRKFKNSNCLVTAAIHLNDPFKDLIFAYTTYPDRPFEAQEDMSGDYYICLSGLTFDQTENEISKFIRSMSFHIKIQDEHNKIIEKDIAFDQVPVDIDYVNKKQIQDSGGTIVDNIRENNN